MWWQFRRGIRRSNLLMEKRINRPPSSCNSSKMTARQELMDTISSVAIVALPRLTQTRRGKDCSRVKIVNCSWSPRTPPSAVASASIFARFLRKFVIYRTPPLFSRSGNDSNESQLLYCDLERPESRTLFS